MLDDWPRTTLTKWPVRDVDAAEFRGLMNDRPAPAPLIRMLVSPAGRSELQLNEVMASSAGTSADSEIHQVLQVICRDRYYDLKPSYIHLLKEPCYLVPQTGVVLTRQLEILTDTVFPSIGPDTIEHRIGGGVTRENLPALFSAAPDLASGVWAPLMSRWSSVYDHAIRECLGQDRAFERAGLTGRYFCAAPDRSTLSGSQNFIVTNAVSHMRQFNTAVVKLPAVMFSSIPYDHWGFAVDFIEFAQHIGSRLSMAGSPGAAPSGERVYVSRQGATARPMRNELELISALRNLDFKIFSGYGLSLNEQVSSFRSARIIVGAHGSGLINAAFAPEGATLLELRALHRHAEGTLWGREYRTLCSFFGLEYCVHISRNPFDADEWEIDLPAVISLVKSLIDQRD